MKYFKYWNAIPARSFTADGTSTGKVTINSTVGFYINQLVLVRATSLPEKYLQIKRIISLTEMIVGPQDDTTRYSAIDLYTTALSATIEAQEQEYDVDAEDGDVLAAVYENHPIAALRSIMVDRLGNFFSQDNPLPVRLSDGSINISTLNAQLDVHLSHLGADADSVRLGDGTDLLAINADGSINVGASALPAGAATETTLSAINNKVATEQTLAGLYATKLDDTSTPNVTYVGKAAIGSIGASAVWRISKIDETSGLEITWADSNSNFDNVWANRTSLTYG